MGFLLCFCITKSPLSEENGLEDAAGSDLLPVRGNTLEKQKTPGREMAPGPRPMAAGFHLLPVRGNTLEKQRPRGARWLRALAPWRPASICFRRV